MAGPTASCAQFFPAAHTFAIDVAAAGCHPSAIPMPAIVAEGEVLAASGAAATHARNVARIEVAIGRQQALYRMLLALRDLPDLRVLAASSVTARAADTELAP